MITLLNGEKWDRQELLSKMDNDTFYYSYLGKHALSSSSIKLLQTSPKKYHYITKYGQNETSPALRAGHLFHTAILEPEKYSDIKFIDVQSRNAKKFKDAVEEYGQVMNSYLSAKWRIDQALHSNSFFGRSEANLRRTPGLVP